MEYAGVARLILKCAAMLQYDHDVLQLLEQSPENERGSSNNNYNWASFSTSWNPVFVGRLRYAIARVSGRQTQDEDSKLAVPGVD